MDDHPEVPSKDRWIFLTGMIRSDTTFVGKVQQLLWVTHPAKKSFMLCCDAVPVEVNLVLSWL